MSQDFSKLLFVRIPKNASTSIYKHLGQNNVIFREREKFTINSHKPLYKNLFDPTHATVREIQSILPDFESYLSFAIVRNPWDRMVSMYLFAERKRLWWQHGFATMPPFEEFCELALKCKKMGTTDFFPSLPQSFWLQDGSVNEILRFETLKEDFSRFLEKNEIKNISQEIPRLNSSNRSKDYRDFFSEKTRQIVKQVHNEDIIRFQYSF